MKTIVLALILLSAVPGKRIPDSVTWENICKTEPELEVIGKVKVAEPDPNSLFSLCCACEDRDYGKFSEYKPYLHDLGCGRFRVVSGWAKTEKKAGEYSFGWMDEIIDGLHEEGITPWVTLAYGNPVYSGEYGLNSKIFGDGPAMDAWLEYVKAYATRYKGKVSMYEVWNEPNSKKKNNTPASYANLYIRTVELIRSIDPDVKFAALSLVWSTREPFTSEFLEIMKKQGKLDLIDYITFHPYNGNPDWPESQILSLRKTIDGYSDRIQMFQGENGAPAALEFKYALSEVEWTEYSQAKWRVRRMVCDFYLGIISTVFSIADIQYPDVINSKGLIRTDKKNRAKYIRPSYYTVANTASILKPSMKAAHNVTVKAVGSERPLRSCGIEENGKIVGAIYWYGDGRPDDKLTREMYELEVSGAKFRNPVLVDPYTGRVFKMEKKGKLPVWDCPLFIFERNSVDFE